FYLPAALRDPHSFPTRRSSDLGGAFPRGAEAAVKGQAPLLFQQPHPGFQFLVAPLQRLAVALPLLEVIAHRTLHTCSIRCRGTNSFESLAQIARLLTGPRVI